MGRSGGTPKRKEERRLRGRTQEGAREERKAALAVLTTTQELYM